MFAVSEDGKKLFLYDPPAGLSIPLLVDIPNNMVTVTMPAVRDLDEHYAAFDTIGEALKAISGDPRIVDSAIHFSQDYTKIFSSEIAEGSATVPKLREMIERHYWEREDRSRHLASTRHHAATLALATAD